MTRDLEEVPIALRELENVSIALRVPINKNRVMNMKKRINDKFSWNHEDRLLLDLAFDSLILRMQKADK